MRAVIALLVVTVPACVDTSSEGDDMRRRIEDQAGGEFLWACDGKGSECEIRRIAGVSPPLPDCDDGLGRYDWAHGRFVTITPRCPIDGAGSIAADRARLVICESDAGCPELEWHDVSWECAAGFCQNADTDMHPRGVPNRIDLFRLCTGDRPMSLDFHGEWDDWEPVLDAACPDDDFFAPCEYIPAGCPDPR